MKQMLVIPIFNELQESRELARKYGAGFEFNDFFVPSVLDDENKRDRLIGKYKRVGLPEYCTLHGAFFDVIPFSPDEKIRKVSDLRIRQSIAAAEMIGARAVVFHTNYNPFLNSPSYLEQWIKLNSEYWNGITTSFPNIGIYLENMFDTTPDIMAALAERLCSAPNFGICFDIAHAALTAVPLRKWAESLGKYVRHVHINDNDLVSDLHLAVGDGKIDWRNFTVYTKEYLNGTTVLIETSSLENQRRSLEKLTADGFITNL